MKLNGSMQHLHIWIPAIGLVAYYSLFWSSLLSVISSVQSPSTLLLWRAATYLPLLLVPSGTVLFVLTARLLSLREPPVRVSQPAVERAAKEVVHPVERPTSRQSSGNKLRAKNGNRRQAFSSPGELLAYFYGEER